MLLNLLSAVVGALPQGLALLVGIGAAAYLVLRSSRAAGIAVVVGVLVLGIDLLVSVLLYPGLAVVGEAGNLTPDIVLLMYAAARALTNGLHGLGMVVLVVAAA
mgnify:CR=1 FL=1